MLNTAHNETQTWGLCATQTRQVQVANFFKARHGGSGCPRLSLATGQVARPLRPGPICCKTGSVKPPVV